jgi:hypothetical protein
MRKLYVVFLLVGIFVLVLLSAPFVFEYNRIENLCRSHRSRITTAHDAIDVIRNYREESSAAGRAISVARHLSAFQTDGMGAAVAGMLRSGRAGIRL